MRVYYIHLTLDRGATYDDCLLLQRVIVCVFSPKNNAHYVAIYIYSIYIYIHIHVHMILYV